MIKIYTQRGVTIREVPYSVFTFSGGEIQVKIDSDVELFGLIWFEAELNTSDSIISLLLLKDAIDQMVIEDSRLKVMPQIRLVLPYIPYGRQDRACASGEAFSLSVFAKLLNTAKFDRVTTWDVHSDVSFLIDRLVNKSQTALYARRLDFSKYDALVSPDAGARDKVADLGKSNGLPVIRGYKSRCPETGNLTGFGYFGDIMRVNGANLLIVDDICDGGGTFLGLAKELLEGGAASVDLLVTHGIFSKGLGLLLDNGISNIYTTNSIINNMFLDTYSPNFTVIEI